MTLDYSLPQPAARICHAPTVPRDLEPAWSESALQISLVQTLRNTALNEACVYPDAQCQVVMASFDRTAT